MAWSAYARRSFSGTTPTTATLVGVLSVGASTATLSSATGFPSTTAGGFCATLGLGTAEEEQIYVGTRVGAALSNIERGFNGTTDQTHAANISIKHTSGKVDYDEANAAVANTVGQVAAKGDLLVGTAANTLDNLTVGSNAKLLITDSAETTGIKWVAPSGDVTIATDGATTIGAGAVDKAMLNQTDVTPAAQTVLDDTTVGAMRTTLGLGTIATQAASAVAITGGTVAGITDLAVADGGTGSSTAADARTALGLAIGTDVQAYDAELAAVAGLTSAANKVPYFTGSGTAAVADFSAFGRSLVDDAAASNARTTLGINVVADQPARVALTPTTGDLCIESDFGHILVYTGAAWVYLGDVPGIVSFSANTSAPTGYLLSYGQTLTGADTTYPGLYAVIASAFKSGSDIILPDLRGRTAAGLDNLGGSDAGRLSLANTLGTAGGYNTPQTATGVASGPESAFHDHTYQYGVTGFAATTTQSAGHTHTTTTPSTTADTNLQPTILLNGFIRV